MSVIQKFYRYLLRHPWYFAGYLLCMGIARSVENLQPFFFKWMIGYVNSGNFDQALRMAYGLGAILVSGTFLHAIGWSMGDRGIMKSAIELQMHVMKKIHALDFLYHTEKSSGKLISLMKRGDDAFFNFFDILNVEFYSLIISLSFMLFAFSSLGSKYVLVTLGTMIFSILVAFPILKVNLRRREIFNHTEDEATAARVDNLINFDTVKYFAKEQYEQNRLNDLLQKWNKAALSYFNTYRFFDITIGNISNIAIVITVIIAISDLVNNHISLADFVLVASFSASFFPKLFSVVMTLRNGARRFNDLKNYLAVLDEKETVPDPSTPQEFTNSSGEIVFEKVSFAYRKNLKVIDDLSLTIPRGESVALVGLSGSGKTTLIKLLMRMYDITSGVIKVNGTDIRRVEKSALRELIGIVPQDPLLFNNTLRHNVSYSHPDSSEAEIWSALKKAKLDEFVKTLPEGLETKVGERGIKLSGGQRQRLAIARVLLEKAQIIVLDEATSSLDSESEGVVQEAFWELVKNPKQPRTSIIIAHRLSTIMRVDRIIVLQNGKIVETGTHTQLLRKKTGVYKHLWSLQQNGFISQQ